MVLQSLAREAVSGPPHAYAEPVAPPAARIFAFAAAKPKILFATSEIADFVQTGGLAAVSASLPRALTASSDMRVAAAGLSERAGQGAGADAIWRSCRLSRPAAVHARPLRRSPDGL